MSVIYRSISVALIACFTVGLVYSQSQNLPKTSAGFPINYNEDSVGHYTLPDLLQSAKGKITKAADWDGYRRFEIYSLYEKYQFGAMPAKPEGVHIQVIEAGTLAINARAWRKQIRVYLASDTSKYKVDVLVYIPVHRKSKCPLFLNLSFQPNALTVKDSAVKPGWLWQKNGTRVSSLLSENKNPVNVERFIDNGIAFATIYYGDIEPDFKQGAQIGIRSAFEKQYNWGAISAWVYGIGRVMDYLQSDTQVDGGRIAIHGVSRLGKTALWAGATDTRFKLVIASCSGEGGAALSRRNYGENLLHITDTTRYFYQFAPELHSFAAHTAQLPVDAHMLVSLIAPRALLLQTGDTDYWSDPKGEFLSACEASKVYQLYDKTIPTPKQMPAAGDTSIAYYQLGYYMHAGGHGTVPSDWDVYLNFLKKYL